MPVVTRNFVIKHTFKNVPSSKLGSVRTGRYYRHFGLNWYLNMTRTDSHLAVMLNCDAPSENPVPFKLLANYEIRVNKIFTPEVLHTKKNEQFEFPQNRKWVDGRQEGWIDLMEWRDVTQKDYLMRTNLELEIHVKILEMPNMKKKLRQFDESVKEFSDVVLVVGGEKFYVSKLFLASQSSFFKTMFLGNFDDSEKTELNLQGIEAMDFQQFLELLHGESAVDASNVEPILQLSEYFDAKTATNRCHEFLLKENSGIDKQKLLELSSRFQLEELKEQCLSGIFYRSSLLEVLPTDLTQYDPKLTTSLLEKARFIMQYNLN